MFLRNKRPLTRRSLSNLVAVLELLIGSHGLPQQMEFAQLSMEMYRNSWKCIGSISPFF